MHFSLLKSFLHCFIGERREGGELHLSIRWPRRRKSSLQLVVACQELGKPFVAMSCCLCKSFSSSLLSGHPSIQLSSRASAINKQLRPDVLKMKISACYWICSCITSSSPSHFFSSLSVFIFIFPFVLADSDVLVPMGVGLCCTDVPSGFWNQLFRTCRFSPAFSKPAVPVEPFQPYPSTPPGLIVSKRTCRIDLDRLTKIF